MTEHIVNLSDVNQKNLILTHIRSLEGPHRISIVKERKRRSDGQNGYFHGVVIPIFAEWCREQGNDWSDEDAKEYLKRRFLTKTWTNEKTGEIFETTGETSKLNTVEFNYFIEQCCALIAELCGIAVPPLDPFYKSDTIK